jgi:hypothetical protein
MKGVMLFTDVRSSSRLWATYPKEMLALLVKHETYIRKTVGKYDSLIVKVMGDAFMIKFAKLEDAVMAAIQLQQLFAKKPIKFTDSIDQIQIRIGIAAGELLSRKVVIQEHKMIDYFGSTVNIASRMESKVSQVGGFALLGDGLEGSKIMNLLDQYCVVQKVQFKYKCDPDTPPVRSERLIQCRDAAVLHLEDRMEHVAFSCTLKL